MKIPFAAAVLLAFSPAPPASAADLISVDEAKALVGKPDVRFLFSDPEREFPEGHIPGSVQAYAHDLHLLDDVRACKGLPMCAPRAAKLIGETFGIGADTTMIIGNGYTKDHAVISLEVVRESPPRWPRVASERMKTSGSSAWSCMRIRSPRMAPPLKGEVGSTARIPTR